MRGYDAVAPGELKVGDIIMPQGHFTKCRVTAVKKQGLLYQLEYVELKTGLEHSTHWSFNTKLWRAK